MNASLDDALMFANDTKAFVDAPKVEREERRGAPRVPFAGAVLVRSERRTWAARAVDVSLRGALVILPTHCVARLGDRLSLAFETDFGAVILEGRVVRRQGARAGLAFTRIDAKNTARLRSYVHRELGSSEGDDRPVAALS